MDRSLLFELLAMTDRHVAEGEQHIARQRVLIDELERDGHDTKSAIELLSVLEQTQAMHVAHRDRIRADLTSAS
jgi:hypothetical protein